MKNSCNNNFEDSNELLNPVEEIAPIYLDAHCEESRRLMVELAKNHGIERQDDLLKTNFTLNQNIHEPIAGNGLLFLDPLGDPDYNRRIVELAKEYGSDSNLLKIDETKNQNFDK